MSQVIIILGNFTQDHSILSSIAIERLTRGLREFRKDSSAKILLTGGLLKRNVSKKPYAFYAKIFLFDKGLSDEHFLPFALSRTTMEDAQLSLSIIKKINVKNLTIITSDFHLARTKIIFNKFFSGYNLTFKSCRTNLPGEVLKDLKEHELIGVKKFNQLYL